MLSTRLVAIGTWTLNRSRVMESSPGNLPIQLNVEATPGHLSTSASSPPNAARASPTMINQRPTPLQGTIIHCIKHSAI